MRPLRVIARMFTGKWLFTTFLVAVGAAVCVRLGIWQLDRLDQRRAFNTQVLSIRALDPLDLNTETEADLTTMEYRAVVVRGIYDFANQAALRNQEYQGLNGYHLLTPLRLADGRAVLVDRGWIPAEGNDTPEGWIRYEEAAQTEVRGMIRLGASKAEIGRGTNPTLAPGQSRLDYWLFVDLSRIGAQSPYSLLPAYIQPNPDPADVQPPIAYQPEIVLTEGPHMGYALQWFTFAAILFFGYPFYLRKQETE